MKIFPRDPIRRAIWVQNVPRENWIPTNNCFLCEVHFAPEMWKLGRKRKLKRDAVPTIIGFFMKKQVMKDLEDDNGTVNKITNDTQVKIQMDKQLMTLQMKRLL
ncbi:THAP domain-containing protein 2-like isoform X2 [Harpegnathos saltator]|uniref:THAP domain-containing protein 2-like isoform X2 n=1 Tax=Harpegnathos saltator TaxID=610380 RepID=UPI000DBED6FF|nr:THAP domain-containing protein 2-like isoform X2 [Harpegnathos saltator]